MKSQDRLVVCTTSRPEHIMINGHASNIDGGRVVMCRLKANTHNIIIISLLLNLIQGIFCPSLTDYGTKSHSSCTVSAPYACGWGGGSRIAGYNIQNCCRFLTRSVHESGKATLSILGARRTQQAGRFPSAPGARSNAGHCHHPPHVPRLGDDCGGGGGEFIGDVVASRLVVGSAAGIDVAGCGACAEILTHILEARRDGANKHAR